MRISTDDASGTVSSRAWEESITESQVRTDGTASRTGGVGVSATPRRAQRAANLIKYWKQCGSNCDHYSFTRRPTWTGKEKQLSTLYQKVNTSSNTYSYFSLLVVKELIWLWRFRKLYVFMTDTTIDVKLLFTKYNEIARWTMKWIHTIILSITELEPISIKMWYLTKKLTDYRINSCK